MKTTKIDVTCGIYQSKYTIRDYGTYITVVAPEIRWKNNSGNLDFRKHKITKHADMEIVRRMSINNETYDDESQTGLEDILN